MSDYIKKNSMSPAEALEHNFLRGAGEMTIRFDNGALEVTHSDGSVLLQTKNVAANTNRKLWEILETCGDMDYRAGE